MRPAARTEGRPHSFARLGPRLRQACCAVRCRPDGRFSWWRLASDRPIAHDGL